MHSRRFFLQSTAAALSLTSFQSAFAIKQNVHCLQLGSERHCQEIAAFLSCERASAVDHAATQLQASDVSKLMQSLHSDPIDIVYGLGTNADEIIVDQLTAETASTSRLTKIFSGHHQYTNDVCRHHLRGSERLVRSLANTLPAAGARWSTMISATLTNDIYPMQSVGETIDRVVESKLIIPSDSPRLLHSWLYVRDARS